MVKEAVPLPPPLPKHLQGDYKSVGRRFDPDGAHPELAGLANEIHLNFPYFDWNLKKSSNRVWQRITATSHGPERRKNL